MQNLQEVLNKLDEVYEADHSHFATVEDAKRAFESYCEKNDLKNFCAQHGLDYNSIEVSEDKFGGYLFYLIVTKRITDINSYDKDADVFEDDYWDEDYPGGVGVAVDSYTVENAVEKEVEEVFTKLPDGDIFSFSEYVEVVSSSNELEVNGYSSYPTNKNEPGGSAYDSITGSYSVTLKVEFIEDTSDL